MKTSSRNEPVINEPITYAFDNAPRCGAKTKNNGGAPCRSPAVKGKRRCRIHGGAKGSGAKLGNTNALKHGHTTKEMKALRRETREILKASKMLLGY